MRVKISTVNLWIFVMAIIIQVFTVNYESAGFISYLKYIICLIGIMSSFYIMRRTSKSRVMRKDIETLLVVPIVFVAITIVKSIMTLTFSQRTIIEFLLIVIPMVYGYCLINTLSANQIEKAMMITLIISFIGYLYNLGMTPSNIIKNLMMSSFSESESALESSQFAGISIALCLYYLYYRKNKIGTVVSFVFVIFTFKRLAILMAIAMLFLPKLIDVSKPVGKKWFRVIIVGVFLCSIGYYFAMIPRNGRILQNILKINLNQFTMGRFWRFSLLYDNPNYVNYGLGSTYTYLMSKWGFALEMDICRLLFEVSWLGVAVFIYCFFSFVKKNWYCTILMMYLFLNMITSHCLASMFSWLVVYMTIGSIEYLDKGTGRNRMRFKISQRGKI